MKIVIKRLTIDADPEDDIEAPVIDVTFTLMEGTIEANIVEPVVEFYEMKKEGRRKNTTPTINAATTDELLSALLDRTIKTIAGRL